MRLVPYLLTLSLPQEHLLLPCPFTLIKCTFGRLRPFVAPVGGAAPSLQLWVMKGPNHGGASSVRIFTFIYYAAVL